MFIRFKELKHGSFKREEDEFPWERYIIENLEDWKTFENHHTLGVVKEVSTLLGKNVLRNLTEGKVMLFTDIHRMSGFPTYQFLTSSVTKIR